MGGVKSILNKKTLSIQRFKIILWSWREYRIEFKRLYKKSYKPHIQILTKIKDTL